MTRRAPSTYVCAVCGLPLTRWLDGYKHVGNAYQHSCGKPPVKQLRTDYDAAMKAVVDYVKEKIP